MISYSFASSAGHPYLFLELHFIFSASRDILLDSADSLTYAGVKWVDSNFDKHER